MNIKIKNKLSRSNENDRCIYVIEVSWTKRSNWEIFVTHYKNEFKILTFYTSWPELDEPTDMLIEYLEKTLNNK